MGNNTVFVLLAGGKSSRMGVDKGLLKYQQTFWVLEQLNRISKTTISEVYLGLGHNYQNYFNAIPWLKKAQLNFIKYEGLKVKIVVNKTPEFGPFSTLQNVLQTIEKEKDVVLNPIDIPILNSTELNKLISIDNDVIIPSFEEKNGHPIKLKYFFWKNLLKLSIPDENARLDIQIKKINPIKISKIKVSDKIILKNLNNKKDWISFLNESD